MKTVFYFLLFTAILIPVSGSAQADSLPVMTFDSLEFNYGTVPEGDTVFRTFTFTNTGKSPLYIDNVKPSCNCTHVASFPQKEVAPGEKGEIKIFGTTQGKPGESNRSVLIISNASEAVIQLELKGFVGPPRGDESQKNNGQQQLDLKKLKAPGWD